MDGCRYCGVIVCVFDKNLLKFTLFGGFELFFTRCTRKASAPNQRKL